MLWLAVVYRRVLNLHVFWRESRVWFYSNFFGSEGPVMHEWALNKIIILINTLSEKYHDAKLAGITF